MSAIYIWIEKDTRASKGKLFIKPLINLSEVHVRSWRDDSVVRAWAAHTEDQCLFIAPTWQLTAFCNCSSGGSYTLFWPLQTLHTHGVQTYMQTRQQ